MPFPFPPKTLLALLLALAVATGKAETAPQRVQDLRYGVALYHFFQQSYVESLTELLIGEARGDMPNHADAARLLRGGISLSYGLDKEAESIFSQLLDQQLSGSQRDRAWFYLAKMAYMRGDHDRALAALQRTGESLAPALRDEGRYLAANLLLREGKLEAAAEAAAALEEDSPWLPYYHFNRGARLTANGDWQQAVTSFQQLQAVPLTSEEAKALGDRAATAAGFAALSGEDYPRAIGFFQQVRLESPLVERAMLGYGWAAARAGDYRAALGPWQALSRRSPRSPSVQESLLAVPHAYEKLELAGAALKGYQQAAQRFAEELASLELAMERYASAPLASLLDLEKLHGDNWFSGGEARPAAGQAPYLAQLIARSDFQLAVRDLRDLSNLERTVAENRERLDLLLETVYARQELTREQLQESRLAQYRQQLQALQQRREQLEQRLAAAEREADGLRLMTAEELELWRLTEDAAARIERIAAAGETVAEERGKLRLYRGLLRWQASEAYPARRWEMQKQRGELELQLLRAERSLAAVGGIVHSGAAIDFEGRIAALQHRADQLLRNTAQRRLAAEQSLRQLAIAALERQQRRLQLYLGQAKLAIARLYDIGSTATVGESAP